MDTVKILAIATGLGVGKRKWLIQNAPKENLVLLELPEPSERDDFDKGMITLKEYIDSFQPDLLIASSRGGKYAVELLCSGTYKNPTLLISAMMFNGIPKHVPVLFLHGINDITVPLHSIYARSSSGTKELIKIVELDDNHSLHCLDSGGELKKYILEAVEMKNIKYEIKPDTGMGNPMNDFLKDIRKKRE